MTVEALPPQDGVRVLVARGELDLATVPALLPTALQLIAGARCVVLDLQSVAFFDSSGVRLVDRLARECGAAGVGFRVVAAPDSLPGRVLQIVGLGDDLVVADRAAAVRSLG